jgi:hypothetical protein
MNHDRLQHTLIIGSNFFPDALFQLLSVWSLFYYSLVFKCPRRKQSGVERSGFLATQVMAPKHDMTRPEKMAPTQSSDPRELFNILLMLGSLYLCLLQRSDAQWFQNPTLHTRLWVSSGSSLPVSAVLFTDIPGEVKIGLVRHNASAPWRPHGRRYF